MHDVHYINVILMLNIFLILGLRESRQWRHKHTLYSNSDSPSPHNSFRDRHGSSRQRREE